MSVSDLRPGDDGELNAASETPDTESNISIDWYGQSRRKGKNDTSSAPNQTGTRVLIVGVALFVMAFVLVIAATVLLMRPQQVLVVTSTQAPPTPVALVAVPSLIFSTVTPMLPPSSIPAQPSQPPQITFYPAYTPVGMNATLPASPPVTAVAMYSVAGASSLATLTPRWTGFTPTLPPAPNDCASFTTDPKRPKIAYESNRDGGWNIYVTDPSGTLFCRLTQPGSLTANHAYQPAWSPDGRQIVFVSDRVGGFQLYTMNADGSNQRQLTNNVVSNYRPSWSPDGSRIAFVEQIDKTVFQLYVINLDGSNSRLLVMDSRASYPAWSPNGSKLVYDSLHNGTDLFYEADGNGENAAKLFDNGLSTSPAHIAWSPDGGQVTFDSSRSGRPQVFTAHADGTGQRQLTNSKAWNYNACWLPDGWQIAFASTRDGHAAIYIMNDDGSNQQPVTRDAAGISDDNPACSSP